MKRVVLALIAAVSLAGCRQASRSDTDLVARAGPSELTVARLAGIAAASPGLPLSADVIESLARRWIEFSLLGLHAAAGDRLTDRGAIVAVAWPDVRAAIVDSFRTVRLAGRIHVTPEQVDSVYRAGDLRFLEQVLKQTTPAMSAVQRDSLRAVLAGVRARLVAGGSWRDANAQNDDPLSRAANGALGLVSRGQMVTPFEQAAFALSPGQLSGIVETTYGFHLIYRPKLEGVRDEFAAALKDRLALPLDSSYAAGLLAAKKVEMVPGVPGAVLYAVSSPLRTRGMTTVLATYDGGRFTVGDLARYLRFLPAGFNQQVLRATDTQLVDLVRSFVVRELKWRAADSAGITLPEERYRRISTAYREQVNRILAVTGLDPDALAGAASSHRGRQLAAAQAVDRFLDATMRDPRVSLPLPPGLVDYLLGQGDWEVFPGGIDRAVLEAAMMRSARRDSTARAEAR